MFEKDLPRDKHFLLFASTGTGNTTTFTMKVAQRLKDGGNVVLLEPTVAAAVNAYDNFCTFVKREQLEQTFTIRLRVGEKNQDSSRNFGEGSRIVHVYTAGKFRVEINKLVTYVDYVLVDEVHARSDPTIVLAQLMLADKTILGRNVDTPCRVCYFTATNIGFEKWGHPLGGGDTVPTTKYPVYEEPMQAAPTSKAIPGMVTLNLDGLAKDLTWSKTAYRVDIEKINLGRVLIFVHSVKAAESLTQQIKKQCPNLNVIPYYAGCGVDIEKLPPQCIIVTTDVLGVSVTIGDCTAVVDLGLENRPEIRFTSKDNSYQTNRRTTAGTHR